MKLNDYIVIKRCPICGKPVYVPAIWNSKFNRPKYPTCSQHAFTKSLQIQVFLYISGLFGLQPAIGPE